MYVLDAHFCIRQFSESILTVKAQSSPSVDVVDGLLSLSLFCVCKLHHAYDTSGAVESVWELYFQLFPTINHFEVHVFVPFESIPFQALNELPNQLITKWHSQVVNSFGVRLRIHERSRGRASILSSDDARVHILYDVNSTIEPFACARRTNYQKKGKEDSRDFYTTPLKTSKIT